MNYLHNNLQILSVVWCTVLYVHRVDRLLFDQTAASAYKDIHLFSSHYILHHIISILYYVITYLKNIFYI